MIVLAILSFLVVVGLLVLFSLIAGNMPPSKKKRAAEVKRLQADMDKWIDNLVPINHEELELFSIGQEKQVLKKGISTTAKGIFTTIYHEPVVAYSYHRYMGKKTNALLYARTADHDYTYWTRNGKTTLQIDNQEVGQIDEKGVLYGTRTGKELARVQTESLKLLPVKVGGREIGSIAPAQQNRAAAKGLHERAFEYLQGNITEKEEQLFLSLAVLELVRRSVE